jgi:modulator of FtsH protease HflC
MNRSGIILLIAAAVVVLLMQAVYVVPETQQVIITRFGEPVGVPVTDPGLQFLLPFVHKPNFFEKRFLEWDGDPNQVPTRDKRFIWVDTYARWRIQDPLKFFQRLRDERGAQSRLDDILDGETRNAVARHNLVEVVRTSNREPESTIVELEGMQSEVLENIETGRMAITREILTRASERAADLGIQLLDLRLKRINYVEEVQKDVFARMIAERNRIAQRYLSEGEGESARIRGEKDRELQLIQSEAYRQAQEIQGKADAEATQIYAQAYNRDPTFYAFMKSLETYEQTLDSQSILILSTDADFLKYLKTTP